MTEEKWWLDLHFEKITQFSNWLEKKIATHSSILAWKIPWMEEPGRLQSMGSQRVGHDWVIFSLFFFFLVTDAASDDEWMLKHGESLVENRVLMVPEGHLKNHFLAENGKIYCCDEEKNRQLLAPWPNIKM